MSAANKVKGFLKILGPVHPKEGVCFYLTMATHLRYAEIRGLLRQHGHSSSIYNIYVIYWSNLLKSE